MSVLNLTSKPAPVNPPSEVHIDGVNSTAKWLRVYVHDYINVRSAPTINAPIIRVLPRGIYVNVEKSGKPWLKVRDDRHPEMKNGYVSATILDNQPKQR